MQDFRRQATVALEVYLQRGLAALEKLERRNYEEFDVLIQKRVAAFHNFRNADFLAKQHGIEIAADANSQMIWQQIKSVDQRIEALIAEVKKKLEHDVKKMRIARAKISKYRSSTNQDSEFQQII